MKPIPSIEAPVVFATCLETLLNLLNKDVKMSDFIRICL